MSAHSSISPAEAAKTQNAGAPLLSLCEKNEHGYVLDDTDFLAFTDFVTKVAPPSFRNGFEY